MELAIYTAASWGATQFGASALVAGLAGTVASGLYSAMTAQTVKQEGPRLDSVKVQSSAQGAPVNRVYGTVAVSGNVFWSTELVEVATTTEQGGKGGGVETTSYSYYGNFAVGLAEGEIGAIRRIWANGEIVYDVSSTATAETLAASAEFGKYFRFYKGTETQLPDPLIESDLGIDNTPAYRGLAYVVFDRLPLANYGNSIPSLVFEVVQSYTEIVARKVSEKTNTGFDFEGTNRPKLLTVDGVLSVAMPSGKVLVFDLDGNYISTRNLAENETRLTGFTSNGINYYPIGVLAGNELFYSNKLYTPIGTTQALPFRDPLGVFGFDGNNLASILPSSEYIVSVVLSADGNYAFICTSPTTAFAPDKWYLIDGRSKSVVKNGTVASGGGFLNFGNASGFGYESGMIENDLTHIWYVQARTVDNPVTMCEIGEDNVMRATYSSGGSYQGSFRQSTIYANNGVAYVFRGSAFLAFTRSPNPAATGAPLQSVLSDVLGQVGVSLSGTAAGTVDGFLVNNQSSARSIIEPLRQSFLFDLIEQPDGTLSPIFRGGASVATITQDEMIGLPRHTRTQELELPKRVEINYLSVATEYQSAQQFAQRYTTDSDTVTSVTLPVVLTEDRAAQLADIMLREAWSGRDTFSISVTRKYQYLQPTDVVTLALPNLTVKARITDKEESGNQINLTLIAEQPSYTSEATGGVTAVRGQTLSLPGPTHAEILDLPPLRAADGSRYGLYVAACGYTDAWSGCVIERDASGIWQPVAVLDQPATLGVTTTALGAWSGGNVVDESNSVTVLLDRGELASVTHEQMFSGVNAALIGNEIVYFRDAVLIAARTYQLTGLLRSRQDTPNGTHAVNERFVLLNSAVMPVEVPPTLYGVATTFRVIPTGRTAASAAQITITPAQSCVTPLAPVQLSAVPVKSGASDVAISWVRQAKVNSAWRDLIDVPLDEASESYRLRIYEGATLRREVKQSAASYSYTTAFAAADGMTTGAHMLTIKVCQLSDEGLPGAEASTTCTMTI